MQERREFLKNTFIGSAGLLVPFDSSDMAKTPVKNNPVVVSTWDFGQAANTEAWLTLGKKAGQWMPLKRAL